MLASPKGWRGGLAQCSLVLVSVLLGLALTEGVLRSTHRLESFFDPLQYEPELATEGWKRAFLRDYGKLRTTAQLGTDLVGYVHDPDLGWDTPGHLRGAHAYELERPPGIFRVIVVGDSYTYGAEVHDGETYPSRLEALLPRSEVLNMGVRAYGIDQAVLKYLKYGRAYHPDLLIVGIWELDYLRTPLTFYRFAKPLYVLDPTTRALMLTHTPVPPPEEVYRTVRRELGPFFFTYALARQAYRMKMAQDPGLEGYYAKWDPLVEDILRQLVEVTRQDHTQLLFVLIETGMDFATDEAIDQKCCERKHLLNILRRLSADAIDLGDALLRDYSRETVHRRMYIHHRGVASGHFTPFGNEAVARELGRFIHERFGVALVGAP